MNIIRTVDLPDFSISLKLEYNGFDVYITYYDGDGSKLAMVAVYDDFTDNELGYIESSEMKFTLKTTYDIFNETRYVLESILTEYETIHNYFK